MTKINVNTYKFIEDDIDVIKGILYTKETFQNFLSNLEGKFEGDALLVYNFIKDEYEDLKALYKKYYENEDEESLMHFVELLFLSEQLSYIMTYTSWFTLEEDDKARKEKFEENMKELEKENYFAGALESIEKYREISKRA